MKLVVIESTPTAEDYIKLRVRSGLSPKSLEAAKKGLPNSLYAVHFKYIDQTVAMGRVIGDGACFFEIVDIAVDPSFQGQGLGKKIMSHIENYLDQAAMVGSYVSMIADKPEFYKKLGYKLTSPEAQGMYKRLKS